MIAPLISTAEIRDAACEMSNVYYRKGLHLWTVAHVGRFKFAVETPDMGSLCLHTPKTHSLLWIVPSLIEFLAVWLVSGSLHTC